MSSDSKPPPRWRSWSWSSSSSMSTSSSSSSQSSSSSTRRRLDSISSTIFCSTISTPISFPSLYSCSTRTTNQKKNHVYDENDFDEIHQGHFVDTNLHNGTAAVTTTTNFVNDNNKITRLLFGLVVSYLAVLWFLVVSDKSCGTILPSLFACQRSSLPNVSLHSWYVSLLSSSAWKTTINKEHAPTSNDNNNSNNSHYYQGISYMMLLSIQFAFQPILTRHCIPNDGTIQRSSVIVAQDVVKIVVALFLWYLTITTTITSDDNDIAPAKNNRNLFYTMYTIGLDTISIAWMPALIGCVQNYCTLLACQQLQPIAYGAINQTKTVFASICCYMLIPNYHQSYIQIGSLIILLLSALIMEGIITIDTILTTTSTMIATVMKANTPPTIASEPSTAVAYGQPSSFSLSLSSLISIVSSSGLAAALLASLLSGLAGAITQRSLQNQNQQPQTIPSGLNGRSSSTNTFLYSAQISLVSCIIGLVVSMITTTKQAGHTKKNGSTNSRPGTHPLQGWKYKTWIPIVSNALGGILVGLVVKYAGVVEKGFACIVGLFLTGIIQNIISTSSSLKNHSTNQQQQNNRVMLTVVTKQQWVGGILAAVSLWMHAAFPYQQKQPP